MSELASSCIFTKHCSMAIAIGQVSFLYISNKPYLRVFNFIESASLISSDSLGFVSINLCIDHHPLDEREIQTRESKILVQMYVCQHCLFRSVSVKRSLLFRGGGGRGSRFDATP